MGNFKEDIAGVTTFVIDVDGVCTDGRVTVDAGGHFVRTFHMHDKFALLTALRRGYRVCVISGGMGASIEAHFGSLGITDLYLGTMDKLPALRDYMERCGIAASEILYMGDDIPDIAPMKVCGMAVCPADAAPEVVSVCRYVSGYKGGQGCVRDIVEQVLRVRGHWYDIDKL